MSRIGKLPVTVPEGVQVTVTEDQVKAKGKLGELSVDLLPVVKVTLEDGKVSVAPANDDDVKGRQMWATTRTLIQNIVDGVSKGFTKNLEIQGVGYRAAVQGKDLVLTLGFSHEVRYPIPAGIEIKCAKPTEVSVSGADKQRVGQVAAEIRSYRKPEPYKGKGVRYAGEFIPMKEGKKK